MTTQPTSEHNVYGWQQGRNIPARAVKLAKRRTTEWNLLFHGHDSDGLDAGYTNLPWIIGMLDRFPILEQPDRPMLDREVVDGWFSEVIEEAVDSDELVPPEGVISEAKRIVSGLRRELPTDTDVYAMDGGKVAVEIYGDFGYSFLLICEPGGSALCIVNVGGVARRARYENSDSLPDGFLREGLKDVRPQDPYEAYDATLRSYFQRW